MSPVISFFSALSTKVLTYIKSFRLKKTASRKSWNEQTKKVYLKRKKRVSRETCKEANHLNRVLKVLLSISCHQNQIGKVALVGKITPGSDSKLSHMETYNP